MRRVIELLKISNQYIIRRPHSVIMYVDKLDGIGYEIYGSSSSLSLCKIGRLSNKIKC